MSKSAIKNACYGGADRQARPDLLRSSLGGNFGLLQFMDQALDLKNARASYARQMYKQGTTGFFSLSEPLCELLQQRDVAFRRLVRPDLPSG